jgi:hypothetical protein
VRFTRSEEPAAPAIPSVVQLAAEVIDLYERNRRLEARNTQLEEYRRKYLALPQVNEVESTILGIMA